MPTRTDIVITIGEVLDCLPPGHARFKRRRYNSFDANTVVGNEENLAPGLTGVQSMKPVKLETEDDDEVSFRNGDALAESSRPKPKRKTSNEKFLEDNANYFQLEVLNSKTRSNKHIVENSDDEQNGKEGFHNSFLDFLKSKGVEKDEVVGRARHKSAETESERESRSRTITGRSRSSNSPYRRSRSTHRELNGRRSKSRCRNKVKNEESASESESEGKTAPVRTLRGRKIRDVSPSGSEAESISSRPTSRRSRRGKAAESEASSDDESKSRASSPLSKPSPRKKRSELDKLLEAVDTSFHFETAAAERKRLSDSGLGPLEIDCSDTGSEASCNVGSKRKVSECHLESEEESKLKKQKVGNNLLKTASPGSNVKSEEVEEVSRSGSESEYDDGSGCAWDGWEVLSEQLQSITNSPVEIDRLHFSFESEPAREGWYNTYKRQDKGDEIVFYPSSTTAPFLLPYELPYTMFLPGKNGAQSRQSETPLGSRPQSKAPSPVRQPGPSKKSKSRKVSESESTDSEDIRRGRGGRLTARGKGAAPVPAPLALPAHLQEANYRVSPRQHASTKSFLTGAEDGTELEDLAEAYIMRDEAELHFPNLSFLAGEDSNDSYSSGSVMSRTMLGRVAEPSSEMSILAATIDKVMLGDIADSENCGEDPGFAAKIPPTRSRISSDQLLSPKKMKKKKKLPSEESVSPLDQYVADNVDPVLLDCLEDELPTVPVEDLVVDPLDLLDTFSRCTSMAVCNKRWLKPTKPDLSQPVTSSPVKPKRRFIYKDDLPGFSIDSDMEAEKLPVSKRRPKEEVKVEVTSKPAKTPPAEEDPKNKKRGPSPAKKIVDPSKPKRIIIYKDDLPGFEVLPDSDVECENKSSSTRSKKVVEPAKKVVEPTKKVVEPIKKTVDSSKKVIDPSKPKRIWYYKDDLPGFEVLPDSDVECEKLPVSKRGQKPGSKMGKTKFKSKDQTKSKKVDEEDDDNVSEDSFCSTSSGPKMKKRKMNRTGFPSPKKKKITIKGEIMTLGSPQVKLDKNSVKNCLNSPKGDTSSPTKLSKSGIEILKRPVSKQMKMDKFITKASKTKSESSKTNDDLANSRRSTTLKAKNYSELESDTESLLEVPVGGKAHPKKLKVPLVHIGKPMKKK